MSTTLANLEAQLKQADENAYRCGEEARDAETRAHEASRYADSVQAEYEAAYEEEYGEPYQAPEPRYREIPGLD